MLTQRVRAAAQLLTYALVLSATGCSGEDAPPRTGRNQEPREDAGSGPVDAGPTIMRDPNANRSVQPELKDQKCAVEIDKLYELSTFRRQPEPTQLSVDRVNSRFAFSYVAPSDACLDAIDLAQLEGDAESGPPVLSTAFDPCARIKRTVLAHNGGQWLLGSVDTRMGAQDLWVQTLNNDGELGSAHRITDTKGEESEPALALTPGGQLVAAWAELDARLGASTLFVRALAVDGSPLHEVVTLEAAEGVTFSSLSLSAIGSHVALGYRRAEASGATQIILDVLDPLTGQRVREAWTLSTQGGGSGSVDVAGDDEGGGIVYSVIDAPSYQLWFQALDAEGRAAPVESAGREGGLSAASRIVGPPHRALDGSLTKTPAGYAVAYRALTGGLVTTSQIRVHFLDRFGREGGVSSISLASESGGRTAIETGYDGRLVVGWSDASETGETKLMGVRVPCVGHALR